MNNTNQPNVNYFKNKINILYLIKVANQIPSIWITHNVYILVLICSCVASSVCIRYINNIEIILSPILTFILYITVLLSIVYILYIQLNIIFRIGHIYKYIPSFINLIQKGGIKEIKIVSLYLLTNSFTILLSLWLINRMLSINGLFETYTISLLIGMIFSIYFFYHYSKNMPSLNYNVKGYSILHILILVFLVLSTCVFGPLALSKILEHSDVLGNRYQDYIKESIVGYMSDAGSENETITNETHASPATDRYQNIEVPHGTSRSQSTSNSITHEINTSTHTDAIDTAVSNAIATSSIPSKSDLSVSQHPQTTYSSLLSKSSSKTISYPTKNTSTLYTPTNKGEYTIAANYNRAIEAHNNTSNIKSFTQLIKSQSLIEDKSKYKLVGLYYKEESDFVSMIKRAPKDLVLKKKL